MAGSMPRERLRRPMSISLPVRSKRRSGQYVGNGTTSASGLDCIRAW
jgi:hypothetical protein